MDIRKISSSIRQHQLCVNGKDTPVITLTALTVSPGRRVKRFALFSHLHSFLVVGSARAVETAASIPS